MGGIYIKSFHPHYGVSGRIPEGNFVFRFDLACRIFEFGGSFFFLWVGKNFNECSMFENGWGDREKMCAGIEKFT